MKGYGMIARFIATAIVLSLIPGNSEGKTNRVPADFATIQAAIVASSNGDTVLVAPGTYFENINFIGKNIVVGSQFILDGNRDNIFRTVIDGSTPHNPDTASCVLIVSGENAGAILEGFTLTNGRGTRWVDEHGAGTYREGGGVLVTLSSPVIRNNVIINNDVNNPSNVTSMGGGGIRIGDGGAVVEHNIITLNRGMYGGGIVLNYCSGTVVRNNMILENSVKQYVAGKQGFGGGGMWIGSPKPGNSSPIIIENNTIYGNVTLEDFTLSTTAGRGAGIIINSGVNAIVRNNILWENHSSFPTSALTVLNSTVTAEYNDIFGGFGGKGNIDADPQFADTSFILTPASPCVDAGDTSSILKDPASGVGSLAAYPAIGNTRNDMGAYGGPRAGHFAAFARSSIFTPLDSVSFGYHLVGEHVPVVVSFWNRGSRTLRIDSLRFKGGAVFSTSVTLPRNIKTNAFDTVRVTWNPTSPLRYVDTMFVFHNSTFINSPLRVVVTGNSIPTPVMEVNYDDFDFGAYDINTPSKDTTITVYNRGTGKDSITVGINPVGLNPPSALSVVPAQFTLLPGSTQGVKFTFYPKQIIKSFTGAYAPKLRFKSFMSDDTTTHEKILRFRITGTLGVRRGEGVPSTFALSQNYPNPFNPSTLISFEVASSTLVTIQLYDLLGREVATLVHQQMEPGRYTTRLDASRLASGSYVYTMRAGSLTFSKKLTILK